MLHKVAYLFASDLDGTLIPHGAEHESNQALQTFISFVKNRKNLALCYATGRHLELALQGVDSQQLPLPHYFICDVGTSLYERLDDGNKTRWELVSSYEQLMQESLGAESISTLDPYIPAVAGMSLQESEKQGKFKRSFYLTPELSFGNVREIFENALNEAGVTASVIISRCSSGTRGLVDVLPPAADKSFALHHLLERYHRQSPAVVYAGDSRNDEAVFLSAIPSIAVANVVNDFRIELEAAISDPASLYFASKPCIAGVVEGLEHFGWIEYSD